MAWRSRGLMVALGIVTVIVIVMVVVLLGRRHPQAKRDLERGLRVNSLPVECSQMKLGVRELRIVPQKTFTGWGYHLICAEPAGCEAELELTFRFLAKGKPGKVSVTRWVHLGRGQTLHDGLIQRPAMVVDRITGVTARLLSSKNQRFAPTPLPW